MNTFLLVTGIIAMVAGAALIGFFGYVAYKRNEERKEEWKRLARMGTEEPQPEKLKPYRWPWAVLAAGALLIILSNSFKIVPTGYTGVKTTFGLIDEESCKSGFNPLIPFVQKISLVNNKQQDLSFDERVWSETSEQTVVYMEKVTVTYQIDPGSSAWIYANVDNWIEKLIDQNLVSSSLKSVARTLTADTVTDRGTIEPLAIAALQEAVDAKYGAERVTIKKVIINNMDFEDSYNAAIAEKSAAIQKQQTQAIENQTNVERAQSEADQKRIAAQGEADAEKIRAQGKADANKIVTDSITDATQRQDAIEKWDGSLPKYIGGDGANVSFGILESIQEKYVTYDSPIGPQQEQPAQ